MAALSALYRNIPGQVSSTAYGVRYNSDDEGNFNYMAGVAVADFSGLTCDLSRVSIPAQKYAVFSHRDHVSTIRRTITTIWNKWLPASGHVVADAPDFEHYSEEFDPRTGTGGLKIWIPIKG
jgi:AraC family transcriptional regulator